MAETVHSDYEYAHIVSLFENNNNNNNKVLYKSCNHSRVQLNHHNPTSFGKKEEQNQRFVLYI